MKTGKICFGVFRWYKQGKHFLPYTAATYRDDDVLHDPPELVERCRTWQVAAKKANRLNMEQLQK